MSVQGINVRHLNRVTQVRRPVNTVVVESLADLPTPVGSTIVLTDNTNYQVGGPVILNNNIIQFGENNRIFGNNQFTDGLVTFSTDAMFKSTGKSLAINTIFASTSGTLFNITGGSGNTVVIQNFNSSGAANLGTIGGVQTAYVNQSAFQYYSTGFKFGSGMTNFYFTEGQLGPPFINNSTGITFPSGASVGFLAIQNNNIELRPTGTGAALSIASGITSAGLLESNNFEGSGIYITGGFLKSDVNWTFNNNLGVSDSMSVGDIYTTGNTAVTTIATAGVFAKVSGYSSTGFINERFVMSASGELKYIGLKPFEGVAVVLGDFRTVVGTNRTLAATIMKNDVALTNVNNQISTDSTLVAFGFNTSIILATNDRLTLAVTNRTDTNGVVVGDYNFNIYR